MPLFQMIYLTGVVVAFGALLFGLGGVTLWMAVLDRGERGARAAAKAVPPVSGAQAQVRKAT